MDPMTLRYTSARSEVWWWYKVMWRRGLWRNWLLMGAIVFATTLWTKAEAHPLGPKDYAVAAFVVAILWLFFALFPQMAFKARERMLTIGPEGIDSNVGAQAAQRPWRDVGPIEEAGSLIVMPVVSTKNAFLVPQRAFATVGERAEFLKRAREWQQAARG